MKTTQWQPALLVLCVLLGTAVSLADEAVDKHPLEPAETTSPRATLKSFLETAREAYVLLQTRGMQRGAFSQAEQQSYRSRLMGCFDLSEVPPVLRESRSEEAVAYLKEVLDRIELPAESEWPNEEKVHEDQIDQWTIPHTEITIARVAEGPKKGQFLFTPDTVDRAGEFYDRVKHLPYQDRPTVTPDVLRFFIAEPGPMLPRNWIKSLPAWAQHRSGGQAVWQWIGLVLTLLMAILAILAIYLIAIRKRRSAADSGLLWYLLSLAFPAAAMLAPVLANYFIREQLRITGGVLTAVTYSLDLVFLFTVVVIVMGAGSRLAAVIIATPWIKPGGMDAQIVRLTCRVLSIVVALIIVLEGGQRIGIPLTTLVAGAGVGGLTLALAAQDTLKNVFGSIMISLDKPFRVGERILVKGYDGVVEEVGLRSTKIRMLTGHQTTIPNEELARSDIENIGRRPHIRRISDIPIPLDTPPEKIDQAVEIVRNALADHEGMDPDFPPRVFFNDFNRDSFNIRMILWYHPPKYWDFLAFSQAVNERIVKAFAAAEIRFAPPTTATFLAQGQPQPLHVDVAPGDGIAGSKRPETT